ncbi:hypothetical protein [Levilactobacillus parabrevis]|uniref:lectin-like domain-containing protein n=1 Tax=Levilactobacillus parabrevis TaxID=357278 RepID=UPI0037575841
MGIKSIILGIMAVGLGLIIFERQMVAQASKQEDIGTVLANAPKGITIDEYFSADNIKGNVATKVPTKYGENHAIQLTSAPNQFGAIWTSDEARMSLGENETASMWLYFGNDPFHAGDGMAFVMQNDERKSTATATDITGNPATGETLGVWGMDQRTDFKLIPDLSAVAKSAIQNSWALEFDTYGGNRDDNLTSLKGNFPSQFDVENRTGYPHIASNYPGDKNTYRVGESDDLVYLGPTWSNWFGSSKKVPYYYVKMAHQGLLSKQSEFLSNGQWHHLTLKWQAPSAGSSLGEMTYYFDDKDPRTGMKLDNPAVQSVQVDISKFHLGADKKIRWGFTGSTGTRYENNLIVFEKVPGLVDVDANAQLVDKSQANKVIDDPKARVYTGDRMVLKYHLNYKSGRDSWQKIQSKLHLPAGIAFNSATVTYDDGKLAADKGTETFSINPDDISGQSVSGTLARSLSKNVAVGETTGATITFTGYATSKIATASTPEEIAGQTSSFEGTNAITQATTSAFQLVAGEDDTSVMTMSLTGDHVLPGSDNRRGHESLASAADVTVRGRIDYRKKSDGTAIAGKTLTLQPRFNGESLQTKVITDVDKRGTYDFTYTIPAGNLLGDGHDNILELFAADTAAHLSATNSLQYTVTLQSGARSMSVSSFATFNKDNPQHMTGRQMRLKPDTNWSVVVHDSVGKNDAWTLQASASPLTSRLRDGLLAGDLKYVDGDGNENSLTQGSVNLEHHVTASDDEDFDITKLWRDKPNRGIFLDIDGGAAQGQYMSRISWTLIQDPITQET